MELLVRTMLDRLGSGLNFGGMDSHVFLPMITAFDLPSGAAEVTLAKYAISLGSLQGKRPCWPMPLDFVAATMMVRRDMQQMSQLTRSFKLESENNSHVHSSSYTFQFHFFHSEPCGGFTSTGAFETSSQLVLSVVPPLSE